MSKKFRPFLLLFAVVIQISHLFNNSSAQDLDVNIKFDAAKPEIVSIEGQRKTVVEKPSRNLSFLTSTADQEVSGERLSNLRLFDSKGTSVAYKRFMPGEYVAEGDFVGWSYQVDLTPPKNERLMSRVSWMMKAAGALFFDDLLPKFDNRENIRSAKVVFNLPRTTVGPQWEVRTQGRWMQENTFFVENITTSTFYVGISFYVKSILYPRGSHEPPNLWSIDLFSLGEFQFEQDQVLDIAWEIYRDYQKRFGEVWIPAQIAIVKFPNKVPLDTWEAETRGRSITIISADSSSKSQSLQQLHEQLRHEMFHLWIPNGINLTGNYDWFYEGFALYQSLKTGVAVNRIRFDDYLDTLSRAYDLDRRLTTKLSLIDVSKNRWSGDNNTKVYARGMLVAFLCDLALLERSKGKRSVEDLLRKLYQEHRPPAAEADANTTVLALLRSSGELGPIVDQNITGSESIEWTNLLRIAGLEAQSTDPATKLAVPAKPSGQQKNLLDKLGYNNWRKLASKVK